MRAQDAALVKRVLNGDSSAFADLAAEYASVAEQHATRILGDPVDAEDVVQEALFKAYRRLDQRSDPARFGPWFAAIVRNTAYGHLRQRLRRNEVATHVADIADLAPVDPAAQLAQEQAAFGAEDIFRQLTPALAEVVRLRIQSGLALADIASHLRVPVGTVKRRLHDARRRIRRLRMKTFGESEAWSVVEAAKSDIESLADDVKRDLIGVAVGGDLVRGDFIPNNSGLLVFPLISNERTLNPYDTPAFRAITEIFDKRCEPYHGCAESPTVWENMSNDEIHLPVSAAQFDPPTVPQPAHYSMFLWDLIDHHKTIYGKDFISALYRPNPKSFTLRMAAETLRLLRTRTAVPVRPPVGFETVAHWQALKMVRVLQLHFTSGQPTLAWEQTLENYRRQVPPFGRKAFGESLWTAEMAMRYPADRKDFSVPHGEKCVQFVQDATDLLRAHVTSSH